MTKRCPSARASMRRRRVADASCRGHKPSVRQFRCRRRLRRVMASRLGFKMWDSWVRGPAAEPRPYRTERRPERSYDALGPRYRRAWKPPFCHDHSWQLTPLLSISPRGLEHDIRPANPSTLPPLFKAIRWLLSAQGVLAVSLIAAPLNEEHRGEKFRHRRAVLIKA